MAWTSPRTWVAGEVPSATTFNTHVRDNLKAIGDPWTSYTPTLSGTGTTQGNAVLQGGYVARGKTIEFWARATVGSTTVIGSALQLSLPFTAKSTVEHAALYARLNDASSNFYLALPYLASTTQFGVGVVGASGAAVAPSPTVPFTWAAPDTINVHGTYEAA